VPTAALPDEETLAAPVRERRHRFLAAFLSLSLAAAVVLVCTVITRQNAAPNRPPAAAPKLVAPASAAAPPMRNDVPPIPVLAAAQELGPIRQQGRVVSRDNGQSARYGDRSFWVFADTLLRGPWGVLSNSGAATNDLDAADGITLTATNILGAPNGQTLTEFIPRSPAEVVFERAHIKFLRCAPGVQAFCNVTFSFWPGPVIADPARHRVLIFYDKVCRGGSAGAPCSEEWGKDLGTGIASLDMATHKVSRLEPENAPGIESLEGHDPTLFFPASAKYASAAVVAGDDVYVYGSCGNDSRCRMAKVPLADIADRAQWRFFSGRDDLGAPKWSADPADAVPTVHAGAAGNTVFWDPGLNAWLNVYMPFGSNALRAQVGGSPFGPWSDGFTLLHTDTAGGGTNYAAYGHTEYAENDGLVQYMSYYQGGTGAQRLVKVTFAP
jgi:hypothetical protein